VYQLVNSPLQPPASTNAPRTRRTATITFTAAHPPQM
jgi:hypothetical protein